MLISTLVKLFYLVGAIAFVWGLRLLSSPDSARRGNILAGIGMGVAILGAMIEPIMGANNNYLWIFAGLIAGGVIGWVAAKKIQMTAMPQMVSVFNGLGGACATVLAAAELTKFYALEATMTTGQLGIAVFTLLIGAVSFTGSMLAFGKLDGMIKDKHVILPRHGLINLILLITVVILLIWLTVQGHQAGFILAGIFLILSLIYGVSFVAPDWRCRHASGDIFVKFIYRNRRGCSRVDLRQSNHVGWGYISWCCGYDSHGSDVSGHESIASECNHWWIWKC